MNRWFLVYPFILILSYGQAAMAFDHQHTAWDQLLKEHVVWIGDGHASRVNYAGFQRDREQLSAYLATLSAVERSEFDSWASNERLAFLINAYNAFTVELILTRYPDLTSIKDTGSLLSSPWKKRFFQLLGKKRHLDDIEHGLIREKGVYDEPRIHFAVVCAAIGCPGLRHEAFVADRLDRQLEDSLVRFLSDKSRNRYNADTGTLEVSKIFDWYKGDFSQRDRGYTSLETFFGKYADLLAESDTGKTNIRSGSVKIRYLDYDWTLNDLG